MIPKRFEMAIQKVKDLEKYDEYLGSFIFGSVARGDAGDDSDLDVKVVIKGDNPCQNISHPFVNGVKLDITFVSLGQLEQLARQEQAGGRIPMIAESIIIFDKDGQLQELKDSFKDAKPLKFSPADYQLQQFFIYHHDEKVKRSLEKDPDSALLSMTLGVGELIKIYYKLNGRWKVSSKRMLKDLDCCDKDFADLLRKFISENDILKKFDIWSGMVNHIVALMGGKLPIEDNLCACPVCKKGISSLLS